MTQEFRSFIELIGRESRFDRNLLQKVFANLIKNDYQIKYAQFNRFFQESWKAWIAIRGGSGKEHISDFFMRHGETIIRKWLGDFLPFTSSKQQLIAGVKAGGTPEDLVFHIFYRFDPRELEFIDLTMSNNKIQDISRETALTRLFLESVLPLKTIISSALGYKYSLMIEETKILTKAKGKILLLEISARPQE